ncbi:MAG: transposase [Clostridium sp.]
MLSQSEDLAAAYYLKEFHACLTMLGNWSKYILNAFDCPYTNGFTEGTNNAIKVIKRNSFGYRNFEMFLCLKNKFTPTFDKKSKKLPKSKVLRSWKIF